MSTVASITVADLSKVQIAARSQKAARLGISTERYVKRLISEDLELDHLAASTSFDELAKPFEKALRGVAESELDRFAQPRSSKARKARR